MFVSREKAIHCVLQSSSTMPRQPNPALPSFSTVEEFAELWKEYAPHEL